MSPGATRGAVASPHHAATAAGADALARGGTAVDAALAAAAVLAVVYPHQCSIGGDAIALVGTGDEPPTVINGSGRAAAVLDPADYDDGGAVPLRGARSVTVPGVLSVWEAMTRRWGRHGLAAALRPAAELARTGFAVSPGLRRELVAEQTLLAADPGARALLLPGGDLPAVGDTLRWPQLARTLDEVAAGVDAFYAGPVGASVVATLRAYGSDLTAADLRDHHATIERPLATRFGAEEYLSSGGNSQGTFFLQGLAALELAGAETLDPLGTDAGTVARILAGAAAHRDRELGDDPSAPGTALSAEAVRALLDAEGPGSVAPGPRPGGDTVAIVAADGEGGWVSLIQSVFHAFGSGIVDPSTGIVLHNRGSAFVLDPRHPGRLAPGRRPPHTLMPVLARDAGGVLVGAHGTMGGRAQPQIHTLLALALARGHAPAEAVGLSRWVIGRLDAGPGDATTVAVEAGVPETAAGTLADAGFSVVRVGARDDRAGHAQLVRRHGDGLVAATDPRADGLPSG